MGTFIFIAFVWTLIAFGAGWLTHWWATRKQRRLLKQYRQQARVLRNWSRPVE
jgi:hypothetical protein